MSKQYLLFELKEHKTKTDVYIVKNNLNDCILGEISWYGPFRKYCFLPEVNTVFDNNCLMEITDFISKLMNDRKEKINENK